MSRARCLGRRAARAQRGVILFIALIVLVAMSLAGISLMRSVDTNVLIAGNLAFRQATTNMADVGVEAARTWLDSAAAGSIDLNLNQPGGFTGYWASQQDDITNFLATSPATVKDFNWATAQTVASPDPAYEIAYVIHRLCRTPGPPGNECLKASLGAGSGVSSGGSKGEVTYGAQGLPATSTTFYRVTVRVAGPRNTYGYVQAVLN